MPSFMELKQEIIDLDLCTSCSLCVAACPQGLISMGDESAPLPRFRGELADALEACGTCNVCSSVCPGYDTGAIESERRIYGRNRMEEERWVGIYKSSHQLTAQNRHILGRVAAGGAGTVLAITALEEKVVDAMIVVGRDEERPWIPKAFITDSVEKVIECAQTSYCLTPNLELLKDSRYDRVGIIGVPCQIQAVHKLLNLAERPEVRPLAQKVAFTMELGCASSTTRAGTEHLITGILNIPLEEVVYMRYREGSYPGKFVVRTRDGTEHSLPFYRLVEEFKKYKTFRCLSCPDWWSGLADISIADGDPNIFDTSMNGISPQPSSTVMVRTETGEKLIKLALQKDAIRLFPYAFENNLGLERKRNRYRSYAAASNRKIPLPPAEDEINGPILSDDEVIRNGIDATLSSASRHSSFRL